MAAHRPGMSYRQAVEEVMQLLSGHWVAAVLAALALGPLQFSVVLAEVNAVEEQFGWHTHRRPLGGKVLARTLDRMERDGLVTRHQDDTVVPRAVRYELTHKGQALLAALRPIAEWALEYRDDPVADGQSSPSNGTTPAR